MKSNQYTVPFDGSFKVASSPTKPPKGDDDEKTNRKALKKIVDEIQELQRIFYAHDHHSLLLIFQAMDAAGKDGTIRAVTTGVNPAGFQVSSFKQPTPEELDHDFLWRTTNRLPERGRIGIFNRSYYEEVLVVRVHPEYLEGQKLPNKPVLDELWQRRFESIVNHEKHMADNGTVILKFWLNVSKAEQKNRFLSRIHEPEKNWKFSSGDVRERGFWKDYMMAYEDALNATSKPWAPWFAIPADDKPYMRKVVANIILETMEGMNLKYPEISQKEKDKFDEMESLLLEE